MPRYLRTCLESAFIRPSSPPEEDTMMVLFKRMYEDRPLSGLIIEERADGETENELEHTIYARMPDLAQLEKATGMEKQSQWEIKVPKTEENAGKGSMRVRKTTTSSGDSSYTRTTKIPNDAGGKYENSMPSNEQEFLMFQFLASAGMVKDRYFFPIQGSELIWEIDVFKGADGKYFEWVKIDLEVKDLEAPLPSFPVTLEDVILPKSFGKMEEAEWDKKVEDLYGRFFLAKNPFLTGQVKAEVQGAATGDNAQPSSGDEPKLGNQPEVPDQPVTDNTNDAENNDVQTGDTPNDNQESTSGAGSPVETVL